MCKVLFKENSIPCHFSGILYKTFGYKLTWKLLENLPQINRTMNISYKERVYQSYWWTIWQYGLWSFQAGGTKLERCLHKNRQTQRKLLKFEFWINGELSKIGHHFVMCSVPVLGIFWTMIFLLFKKIHIKIYLMRGQTLFWVH